MYYTDERIDFYIEKSQPFAQSILKHLRGLVHQACPTVKETVKWGFPHFTYADAILCSMAAFKQHCAFTFWKAAVLRDSYDLFVESKLSMGHLGKITLLSDLPADSILLDYIKEAVQLNLQGIKKPASIKKRGHHKPLVIPVDFAQALQENSQAQITYQQFSYSNKKEYLEWITEAKNPDTRIKRLNQAVEWLTAGKVRNWKYIKSGTS